MTAHVVLLKQGWIVGTTGTNLDGEQFYKFLGVPYAKPPLGLLRFKAPQPAEPWIGIRECTKDGNSCLSVMVQGPEPSGSEDCLYLNVHTKELPKPGLNRKPVMVFFHGGAFTLGTGTQEMCDPKYLLMQDIVLVTVNYRLGIFGFLSLEDTSLDVPGNAGLKDQALALKWVQENISNFNGDPNNVTIFGVSAGGASVQFQLISPTTKGLFHKAIAQSGSVLNSWAWGQKNGIQIAEKLGKIVSSEKEALDVIMKASGDELIRGVQKIEDNLTTFSKRRPFGPVVENPNPTAFLWEDPWTILSSGKFQQVPIMQGVCSNEGLLYELCKMFGLSSDLDPTHSLIPWNMDVQEPLYSLWTQKIHDLYFKNGVTRGGIHRLIGDVCFEIGTIESTKLMLKWALHPIFLYIFSYNAQIGTAINKAFQLEEKDVGISHGMDGNFLFPSALISTLELSDEDIKGIKDVTKIWTDFARTGIPHPEWKPVSDENNIHYLKIDKKCEMITNPAKHTLQEWSNFIKEVGRIDSLLSSKPN